MSQAIPPPTIRAGAADLSGDKGIRGREGDAHRGRKIVKKFAAWALVALASAGLLATMPIVARTPGVPQDFISFYAAGQIVRQGDAARLYSRKVEEQFQGRLPSQPVLLPFFHPPYEALLIVPLTLLSYEHAFLVWDALNLALLAGLFLLIPGTGYRLDEIGGVVWLLAMLPFALEVLLFGQDTLLLAILFMVAFLALKRRWDLAAGFALGIGLFHYEFVLPLLFIFFLRRRWRVLLGSAISGIAVVSISVAVVGWRGALYYVKLVLQGAHLPPESMASLHGFIGALLGGMIPAPARFAIVLLGSVALMGWAAWQFRDVANPERRDFDLQFSLALLVALVSGYHLYPYSLTLLAIVFFPMLGYESIAYPKARLRDRPCAQLLLLLFLVPAIGFCVGYSGYCVLFVVLAGLMVWLSQEIAALRHPQAMYQRALRSKEALKA